MQASADSLDFAPPPEPAAVRAFVFAVIAHLLLLLALTWGIHWQKETTVAAEAELWSRMPEQAAPPPAPPPVVQPQPVPPPVVEKPAPPPVAKEPDIVQEREKKRLEEEARRRREEEERKLLEAKKEQQQEEAAKREKLAKEKAAEERKKQELQAKAEKDKKALDEKKLAQMRDENMRRMQGLADSSGGPNATGSALRSKGPSASYAGRIAGRIKPNIVFTDIIGGNPAAVVQLRVAPDGTIVGSKLVKSSGARNWDEAVLRAIERTGSIPRDTDGSVVPEFEIEFRPKD
jgi:colicin import membrane protein